MFDFFWGWVTTDVQILKPTKDIESLQTLPSKTSNAILDSVFLPEHFPKQTHVYFKSEVHALDLQFSDAYPVGPSKVPDRWRMRCVVPSFKRRTACRPPVDFP